MSEENLEKKPDEQTENENKEENAVNTNVRQQIIDTNFFVMISAPSLLFYFVAKSNLSCAGKYTSCIL